MTDINHLAITTINTIIENILENEEVMGTIDYLLSIENEDEDENEPNLYLRIFNDLLHTFPEVSGIQLFKQLLLYVIQYRSDNAYVALSLYAENYSRILEEDLATLTLVNITNDIITGIEITAHDFLNANNTNSGDAHTIMQIINYVPSNTMFSLTDVLNNNTFEDQHLTNNGLNQIEIDSLPIRQHICTDDNDSDCLICKDNVVNLENIYSIPCGHVFHQPCLYDWLKIKKTCPMCRQLVINN